MSELPTHVRHCMLYEFQLDNNASAAARNIGAALGQGKLLIAHVVIGSEDFEKETNQ